LTLVYTDYEQKILELINRLTITSTLGAIQNQRLVFGGTAGSGGGHGGPFQPFVGKLTQTSVTYDTSELAQIAMPTGTSSSLLDNLNHIRAGYSIKPLYTPTNYYVPSGQDSTLLQHLEGLDLVASGFAGHTIQDEGIDLPTETYLNFIGSMVTVTDNPGNSATDVTLALPPGEGWPFTATTVDPGGQADYTCPCTALDNAYAGGIVLVGPGVYVEDFTIPAGVALVGLGRTGVRISGYVTVGSGSWFENFEISASGEHAIIIPAGTSGANLVNLDARTVGIDYHALSASGNARVTEGRYYTHGSPGKADTGFEIVVDIDATKDNFIEDRNPNAQQGGADSFLVGHNDYGGGDTILAKGLLYFDLSGVPDVITDASLYLYGDNQGSGVWTLNAYRILAANANWPEDGDGGEPETTGSCWNYHTHDTDNWAGSAGLSTADTDFDSSVLGALNRDWSTLGNGWVEVELSATEVEKIRNGDYTNAGLLLRGSETSGKNYMYFQSREDAGDTAPYLKTTYQTAPTIQTMHAYPVAVPSGINVLLDDPEILGSGVEGTGWRGAWYDRNQNVNIKGLVQY
jgi:hypothetical protein